MLSVYSGSMCIVVMVPESSAALLTAQEAHSESLVHNTQQRGEAT